MSLRKASKFGMAAVLGAVGLTGATGASAGILAQSIIDIQNLTFRVADGATGRSSTAINPALITPTSSNFGNQFYDLGATLNGTANNPAGVSIGINALDQVVVIDEVACVPAGCNAYIPGTDLSLGDNVNVATSSIDFEGNAFTTGADLLVDSTVSLAGGSGSASNNTSLGLTFNFTVQQGSEFGLEIYFDASSIFTTVVQKAGESASATQAWNFKLTKAGSPFPIEFEPRILNPSGGQINSPSFNVDFTNPGETFEFETDLLTSGEYQLSLTTSTAADGTVIPAPMTLALFGLGMVGAGLAGRRKSNSAC